MSLEGGPVSSRGLRSGLVGAPEQVAERIPEFERAGLDLLLLRFSPRHEETERFADEVISLVNGRAEYGIRSMLDGGAVEAGGAGG